MQRDLVFGSATLAVSAVYYLMAAAIPASLLDDAIGPQGLPQTYAVLLAGLSLLLIVRSLARRTVASTASTAPRSAPGRVLWRGAGMLMIGIVYLVVVPWLGYLLSLAGLIVATTHYQGGALNRQVAVVAASGAVFFWLLFVLLLRIPQPVGLWPFLHW
jgi:hypothetical protein